MQFALAFPWFWSEEHRKKRRETEKIIVPITVMTTVSPSILFTGL